MKKIVLQRIDPTGPVWVTVGFSEAAIFTKIAGTRQLVQLIPDSEDGRYRGGYTINPATLRPVGGYFLFSELGIYQDRDGFYIHQEVEEQKKPAVVKQIAAALAASLILAACSGPKSTQRPAGPCDTAGKAITLTITHTRNGYTYARNSYRWYRAKLDTTLTRGTKVKSYPCSDTAKIFFQRVN